MTASAKLQTIANLVPVIGLEVHAQLSTQSKMFCSCSAAYASAQANSHVCAVCCGMPGAMPTINRRAVEYTVMTALALHCRIAPVSKFDRKNYPYPDLAKGYQISQYDLPLGADGWVTFQAGGREHRCGIIRVHLEEDTGKTSHVALDGRDVSLVDYNRSGVPLMEIVSAPDIESPEAAREYFASLRRTLMYLGVCDGNLQEGSMRADVNVSLRRPDGEFGTKVEIKNLNSFRAVQKALEYEIARQQEVLRRGEEILQETRGWSEKLEETRGQRTKEYAHDYRYFPEPDLPMLSLTTDMVDTIAASLPELPDKRRARFQATYGLTEQSAGTLTDDRSLADFFEAVVASIPDVSAVTVANWVGGEYLRLWNERSTGILPVRPEDLGQLIDLVERGEISGTAGKTALNEVAVTGERPAAVVARLDLRQISDPAALQTVVVAVISENPALVQTYLRGKTNVLQALVGKVMAATRGKASPEQTRDLLLAEIASRADAG